MNETMIMDGDSAPDPREEGAALLRQGRFAEAANFLRQATQQDPGDESSWRLLGGALASMGDQFGAVSAFQRASVINPTSAKNHYNLAVALQGVGQIEEARDHLQKALEFDSSYEQARARLNELGAAAAPPQTFAPPPPAAGPSLAQVGGGQPAPDVAGPPPGAYPPPGGYAPPVGYVPPQPPYPPQAPSPGYSPPGGSYPAGPAPYGGPFGPPPPVVGQGGYGAPAPPVNGNTVLILAILGLVCLQILSPIAWVMGNNALQTLDQYPNADQSQRGIVNTGRIIGIVGTVFLVVSALGFVGFIASSGHR